MEHSKVEVFYHFVWATKSRWPLLTPDVERVVLRTIQQEAGRLGCSVLAANGTEDHVHLVVKAPSTASPARIAQMTKGVSSRLVNAEFPDLVFDWQDNYAVFSLSPPHVARAVQYVLRQKEHHGDGTVWAEWEATSEGEEHSEPDSGFGP
jgi:REP element-mobilizing transposase RayT